MDDSFESEVLCVVERNDDYVAEDNDHLDEDQNQGSLTDLFVE